MRVFLIALGSLLTAACASPAHAGIDWNYLGDKEVSISSGASTVTFLGTHGQAANSTGVVLYNLVASSTASNDAPDHFDKSYFQLAVSIVDELARSTKTGNDLATVILKGFFTADVSKGSLSGWAISWDADGGSVVLGNDTAGRRVYDLKVDGFLPPSPNNPTVNGLGVLHAQMNVRPYDEAGFPGLETPGPETPEAPTQPTITDSPEPGSLLLIGLGMGSLAVYCRGRILARTLATGTP